MTNLRKRENKWINTGKNWGGGTNLRKRENKWISTGNNRVWETNLRIKKKTNGLVQVKHGWGDQPKEKRKRMD